MLSISNLVTARDTAGIDSHSEVVQDVVVTNDLTGLIGLVNQILLPNDYKYTTASGSQSLRPGDHVRLGAAYAGNGIDGAIYRGDVRTGRGAVGARPR